MKLLKSLFDFYIYSSLHVALAVFSLAWLTLLEFELDFDQNVLFFIYFASITGYNFVKYFGVAKFHHRRLTAWLKIIQLFSLICFVVMCYFAFMLQLKTLLFIAGFGIVTFLYAIPFLPRRLFMDEQKNLRNIGGLKVYVIAMVWAGVTVLLPLLNSNYNFDSDVWIITIQRFILVMILMLPFEIRDLRYDSLKLSTIPQKIGVKYTKLIGVFLGLVFFLLESFKDEVKPKSTSIALIIMFVALLFLVCAKKTQNNYYSSFWVESVPMLWLILYVIF